MSSLNGPFIILRAWRSHETRENKQMPKQKVSNKKCWSQDEHRCYIKFFRENMGFSNSQQLRKSEKIFVTMSSYIKSRNHHQIKSHHQKMLVKFGSIENVLDKLEQYLLTRSSRPHGLLGEQKPTELGREKTQTDVGSSEEGRSKQEGIFEEEEEDLFDILSLGEKPCCVGSIFY